MSILLIQEELKQIGLDEFAQKHALEVREHPYLPLVLLKYSQINSDTYCPIVRECRSIVLEKNSWNVVAKPLRRFYNFGQYPPDMAAFNFEDCTYFEKIDGSYMQLFYYQGEWIVTTSGSFALQNIQPEMPTWSDLFYDILNKDYMRDYVDSNLNFIFELTSPYNQVVKPHLEASLTLLTIMDNKNLSELSWKEVTEFLDNYNQDNIQKLLSPTIYPFKSTDEAMIHYQGQPPTFEGYVLKDNADNRIKLKNPAYVNLHHMKDNGNMFLMRRMVPLVLQKPDDIDEICSYFPELKSKFVALNEQLNEIFGRADLLMTQYNGLVSQKEFALSIKEEPFVLKVILFQCRKQALVPSSNKLRFEDVLIKYFEDKDNSHVIS